MHPIRVVLGKELLDGRRDRRALMSAFIFPFLAPILVYAMMTAMVNLSSQAQKTIIPMVGIEHAPHLIAWLKEQNVSIEAFKGDPQAAVRDKKKDLVVIIPQDYEQRMANAKPVAIELVSDGSRTDARPAVSHFQGLIRRYNNNLASLRLIARGVAPEVMSIVVVEGIDVASKQQRAAAALNFIPLYIILAAFVSGMGIAVDSTAGERERKTIEPLLINPIERHDIVIGKWLAASLFSCLGMVLTLVLCVLAMSQVPLEEIGLNFHVTSNQIVLMIIATLPLGFLASSMQMLLGIFAKSFKDAQSYIGILTMLPMLPFLYLTFSPIASQDWMYLVPLLGQQILLSEVLGAKAVPLIAYFYSAVSGLVAGLGLVMITARLFQKETIIRG
ncbi:MAG: ABC transporter permease [Pseudomonadales bacterium]|jgi:sodium transport system permease protein|tara:strand:- start:23022 stop:24185 length:1164 start_codon:yes stop_codon:yes gene_type:complete